MKKAIIKATTGEIEFIELTAEEKAINKKMQSELEQKNTKLKAKAEAQTEAEAEKQAKLESAKAKLKALGLDEGEVQAILGL